MGLSNAWHGKSVDDVHLVVERTMVAMAVVAWLGGDGDDGDDGGVVGWWWWRGVVTARMMVLMVI
jgi:hypothetical protein